MARQELRRLSRYECFFLVTSTIWRGIYGVTLPIPNAHTASLHWYQSLLERAYFGKTSSRTQYTNTNHRMQIRIFP